LTPLPRCLQKAPHNLQETSSLVFWRLEKDRYLDTWDSGEGSFLADGRWHARGNRVLYGALDPATAILEVAVHSGFNALDCVAHSLICARLTKLEMVKVLEPHDFPNPAWLRQGVLNPNQHAFAAQHMQTHAVLVVPSAVSSKSWNAVIKLDGVRAHLQQISVERFSLDTRLAARL
jgi:RES domain-containing protein